MQTKMNEFEQNFTGVIKKPIERLKLIDALSLAQILISELLHVQDPHAGKHAELVAALNHHVDNAVEEVVVLHLHVEPLLNASTLTMRALHSEDL